MDDQDQLTFLLPERPAKTSASLDFERALLALEVRSRSHFCILVERTRPRWLVWENVPGVLSADGGRAFGTFLGGLAERGYGFAYRILDAQYFGVPQRRRRLFLVGHSGGAWQPCAAVLFERDSLSGDPAPRRKARQTTPTISSSGAGVSRVKGAARSDDLEWIETVVAAQDDLAGTLQAHAAKQWIDSPMTLSEQEVVGTLRGSGSGVERVGRREEQFLISHPLTATATGGAVTEDGSGRGVPLVAFTCKDSGGDAGRLAPTLRACAHAESHANGGGQVAIAFYPNMGKDARTDGGNKQAVAFQQNERDEVRLIGGDGGVAGALAAEAGMKQQNYLAAPTSAIRRLTPRECERLMGFPDDYTLVPWRGKPAPDGPRYRALGNSMVTNVVAWIGRRIQLVEELDTASL